MIITKVLSAITLGLLLVVSNISRDVHANSTGSLTHEVPAPTPAIKAAAQILFDDFSYSNQKQLEKHGWIIRTKEGWPGVPGATWSARGVTIVKDPSQRTNLILRMTSATDGTATNTTQTQICHQRKYLDGTYAARVRFTDIPVTGPGGDQIVESFYTISPLKAPMDPDYSELDFEYLPNGGWGIAGPTLYATTWETFSPEPNWKKDNVFKTAAGSQSGWHTLVTQVHGSESPVLCRWPIICRARWRLLSRGYDVDQFQSLVH